MSIDYRKAMGLKTQDFKIVIQKSQSGAKNIFSKFNTPETRNWFQQLIDNIINWFRGIFGGVIVFN